MPGPCLQQFKLRAIIGEGALGTVYEAEHRSSRHRVAVKIFHQPTADRRRLALFRDDARAVRLLHHPHIARIVEAGRLPEGQPYLITELIGGETLGDRLRRLKCLSVVDALEFAAQAAGALAAAHEHGVVHRGLTREDLFLIPDLRLRRGERLKVADFATARLRASGAAGAIAGELPGSGLYRAPEQLLLRRRVDHRADIYALGAIVYHALCGAPPFVADTPADLVAMHLHEPPPSPRSLNADVPPDLDAIILRALAKRPDARFESMAALVAALKDVTVARPAPRPARVPNGSASATVALALCTLLVLSARAPGEAALSDITARRASSPRGPSIVQLPANAGVAATPRRATNGRGGRRTRRPTPVVTAVRERSVLDRDDLWARRL